MKQFAMGPINTATISFRKRLIVKVWCLYCLECWKLSHFLITSKQQIVVIISIIILSYLWLLQKQVHIFVNKWTGYYLCKMLCKILCHSCHMVVKHWQNCLEAQSLGCPMYVSVCVYVDTKQNTWSGKFKVWLGAESSCHCCCRRTLSAVNWW